MTTTRKVHVDPATGEEREPIGAEPFMEVGTGDDGYEYVTMRNIIDKSIHGFELVVPPHGQGWELVEENLESKFWKYRRRVRV